MTAKQRSRHGMHRELARIRLAGWRAIDRRSAGARDMLQLRAQLVADCGGEANVSAAKMELIDLAVRTRALIAEADNFLLEQRSIINRRRKSFIPLVAQRQALGTDYWRFLREIGLERVARPVGNEFEVNWSSEDASNRNDSDQKADEVSIENSQQPGETQSDPGGQA
jgi:hypothetical protein